MYDISKKDYFEHFFTNCKDDFERLEELEDGVLLAMLDDIVQVLALENGIEWASNDAPHREFRKVKSEIMRRLSNNQK